METSPIRWEQDDVNPTGYQQVVEELAGEAVHREYAYGWQRIDEGQFIGSTWTTSFYSYDGGGTVRQLTSTAGAVTDTYDYDAFGNLLNHTVTTPNSYLYRGEQHDSDLGLYYLRARYYSPVTGRFLSRDPEAGKLIDPVSLHKYLYANGDPSNRIDPTGRADLAETATIIGKAVLITTTVICGEIELINHFVEWTLHKEAFPEVLTKPCDYFADIVFLVALFSGGLAL